MTQDKNDFLAEYIEEVQTYIPIMRTAVRELRENPHKRDAQEELHRLTHIIHGASAMIGIRTLNRIAGCMEETLEQVLEGRQIDEASLSAIEATVSRIEQYCQSLQQGFSMDDEQLISLTEADFRQLDADMDALFALDPMQEPITDDADLFAPLSGPDPEPDSEPAAEPEADLESLYQSMPDFKTLDADVDAMFSLDTIQEPIIDAADALAPLSDPVPDTELMTEPEADLDTLYQSTDFKTLDSDVDALFSLDSIQEQIIDPADALAPLSDPVPDTELMTEPEADLDTLYQSTDFKKLDSDVDAVFLLDSIQEQIIDPADADPADALVPLPDTDSGPPEPDSEPADASEANLESLLYQSISDFKELDSDADAMFSLDSIQEPISDDDEDLFAPLSGPAPDASGPDSELMADGGGAMPDGLESTFSPEELRPDVSPALHRHSETPTTAPEEKAESASDSLFSDEEKQILYEGFLEEAEEHFQQLNASIQILSTEIDRRVAPDARQKEEIRKVRRAVHTIKGASAVIGLRDIAAYAHGVEDFLDWLYEDALYFDPERVENLASALDHLSLLVDAPKSVAADRGTDLLQRLLKISREDKPEDVKPEAPAPDVSPALHRHSETPTTAPEEKTESASDSLFSDEEKQILYEGFLEEAEEHFQQLNASIQILSTEIDRRVAPDAQQKEEIRKVRRAVHTIKGASAVIGLRDIAAYAHGVEDFLDWLYEDALYFDPERMENLASALDHLSLLVDAPESAATDRGADLLQRLLTISQEVKPETTAPEVSVPEASIIDALSDISAAAPTAPEADAKPDEEIQAVPGQTDSIPWEADAQQEADPAEMSGDGKGYGRRWADAQQDAEPAEASSGEKGYGRRWTDAQQEVDRVEASSGDPGYGRRKDDAELVSATEASRTLRIHQGQMDTLINLSNELLVGISGFDQNMNLFKKALEEMELASRRLKGIALELETKFEVKALDQLSRHFLHLDQTLGDIKASQSFAEFDSLELDRYTQLNLIIRSLNESAIDMAAIHTHLDGVYSGIGGDISRQHRTVREMQVQMLRTRMSPISILSPRLSRTLRDVASRLGKRARLVIEGEQVELDRMVLEKLADPFMHLVRNAIHHGIESPSERQARKKPAVATLTLSARREGNHMVIRFSDDGQGLDFDAIRKKARRSGLKDRVDQMSAEQLTELIFYSGFSTKAISEISGRGVGMDVVRENIKGLQGTVSVETQPGAGTSFVMRIPITLGVVRALLIKIGTVTYGIALDDIKDIHRLEPGSISFTEGTCQVAGKTLPWHSLTALLGFAGHEPDEDLSLVLNMFSGKGTLALSIPHITGQKEIVIKGLGTHLRSVPGVSGAAVMGDGSIVPMLNIPDLVQAASQAEHRSAFSLNLETPDAFTVMIVDDSISIRRVMSRLVTHNGWDPVEAKDGLDAVEQLENGEVRPDVILLDIEMPRMNGFEFLAKLPRIPGGKDVPVIMLTSRTSDKHQEKAIQLGARAFLNKPVKDEELADTVRRLTGHSNVSVPESEGRVLA